MESIVLWAWRRRVLRPLDFIVGIDDAYAETGSAPVSDATASARRSTRHQPFHRRRAVPPTPAVPPAPPMPPARPTPCHPRPDVHRSPPSHRTIISREARNTSRPLSGAAGAPLEHPSEATATHDTEREGACAPRLPQRPTSHPVPLDTNQRPDLRIPEDGFWAMATIPCKKQGLLDLNNHLAASPCSGFVSSDSVATSDSWSTFGQRGTRSPSAVARVSSPPTKHLAGARTRSR